MNFKSALLSALLLFFSFFAAAGEELTIIASCDLHGNIPGFARLIPRMRSFPDAVKIDLGDIFQGDPLCDWLSGSPMIDLLNQEKYDIFVPGNHEFELPPRQLAELLKKFNGTVLGQWQLRDFSPLPWQLIRRNGFTLAVIGMTDNGIYRNRKLYPEVKICSELDALDAAMQDIRRHKTDAVILVRHGGNYFNGAPLGKILRKYPEIRLVICGHSHKEIAGQRSGRVLIVQPGPYAASAVAVTLKKLRRNELFITSRLLRSAADAAPEVINFHSELQKKHENRLRENAFEITSMEMDAEKYLVRLCAAAKADCAVIDLPELPPGNYTMFEFLKRFPYRNQLIKAELSPGEFILFSEEKAPAGRRRFISKPPAGNENVTLVLDTFQFSRSKALRSCRSFKILPFLSRNIILKDTDDEKTISDR